MVKKLLASEVTLNQKSQVSSQTFNQDQPVLGRQQIEVEPLEIKLTNERLSKINLYGARCSCKSARGLLSSSHLKKIEIVRCEDDSGGERSKNQSVETTTLGTNDTKLNYYLLKNRHPMRNLNSYSNTRQSVSIDSSIKREGYPTNETSKMRKANSPAHCIRDTSSTNCYWPLIRRATILVSLLTILLTLPSDGSRLERSQLNPLDLASLLSNGFNNQATSSQAQTHRESDYENGRENDLLAQLLQSSGSLQNATRLLDSLIAVDRETSLKPHHTEADYNQVKPSLDGSSYPPESREGTSGLKDQVPLRVFLPPPLENSEISLLNPAESERQMILSDVISARIKGSQNANSDVHYDDEQAINSTNTQRPTIQLSKNITGERFLDKVADQLDSLLVEPDEAKINRSQPQPQLNSTSDGKELLKSASSERDEDGLNNNESISSLIIQAGNPSRRLIANYSHWINHEQVTSRPRKVIFNRDHLSSSIQPANAIRFIEAPSSLTTTTVSQVSEWLMNPERDFKKYKSLTTSREPDISVVTADMDFVSSTEAPSLINLSEESSTISFKKKGIITESYSTTGNDPTEAKSLLSTEDELKASVVINDPTSVEKEEEMLRKQPGNSSDTGVHKIVFVNSMPQWSSTRTRPVEVLKSTSSDRSSSSVIPKRSTTTTTTTTTTELYPNTNDWFVPENESSESTISSIGTSTNPETKTTATMPMLSTQVYMTSTTPPRATPDTTTAPTKVRQSITSKLAKKVSNRKGKSRLSSKSKKKNGTRSKMSNNHPPTISTTSIAPPTTTTLATTTTTTTSIPTTTTLPSDSITTVETIRDFPATTTVADPSFYDKLEEASTTQRMNILPRESVATKRSAKSLNLAHLFLGTNSASNHMPTTRSSNKSSRRLAQSKSDSDSYTPTTLPITSTTTVATTTSHPEADNVDLTQSSTESMPEISTSGSMINKWHAVELNPRKNLVQKKRIKKVERIESDKQERKASTEYDSNQPGIEINSGTNKDDTSVTEPTLQVQAGLPRASLNLNRSTNSPSRRRTFSSNTSSVSTRSPLKTMMVRQIADSQMNKTDLEYQRFDGSTKSHSDERDLTQVGASRLGESFVKQPLSPKTINQLETNSASNNRSHSTGRNSDNDEHRPHLVSSSFGKRLIDQQEATVTKYLDIEGGGVGQPSPDLPDTNSSRILSELNVAQLHSQLASKPRTPTMKQQSSTPSYHPTKRPKANNHQMQASSSAGHQSVDTRNSKTSTPTSFDLIQPHHLRLIDKSIHVLKLKPLNLDPTRSVPIASSVPFVETTTQQVPTTTTDTGALIESVAPDTWRETRPLSLDTEIASQYNVTRDPLSFGNEFEFSSSTTPSIERKYPALTHNSMIGEELHSSRVTSMPFNLQVADGTTTTIPPTTPLMTSYANDPLPSVLFHNSLSSLFQYKLANRTQSKSSRSDANLLNTSVNPFNFPYPFEYHTKRAQIHPIQTLKVMQQLLSTTPMPNTVRQSALVFDGQELPQTTVVNSKLLHQLHKLDRIQNDAKEESQVNLGFYGNYYDGDKDKSGVKSMGRESSLMKDARVRSNPTRIVRREKHKPPERRTTEGGNATSSIAAATTTTITVAPILSSSGAPSSIEVDREKEQPIVMGNQREQVVAMEKNSSYKGESELDDDNNGANDAFQQLFFLKPSAIREEINRFNIDNKRLDEEERRTSGGSNSSLDRDENKLSSKEMEYNKEVAILTSQDFKTRGLSSETNTEREIQGNRLQPVAGDNKTFKYVDNRSNQERYVNPLDVFDDRGNQRGLVSDGEASFAYSPTSSPSTKRRTPTRVELRKRRREPPGLPPLEQNEGGSTERRSSTSGVTMETAMQSTQQQDMQHLTTANLLVSLGNLFSRLPLTKLESISTSMYSVDHDDGSTQSLSMQQKKRRELNKFPPINEKQTDQTESNNEDTSIMDTLTANASQDQRTSSWSPLVDEFRAKALLKTMMNLGVPGGGSSPMPDTASGLNQPSSRLREQVRSILVDKNRQNKLGSSTNVAANRSTTIESAPNPTFIEITEQPSLPSTTSTATFSTPQPSMTSSMQQGPSMRPNLSRWRSSSGPQFKPIQVFPEKFRRREQPNGISHTSTIPTTTSYSPPTPTTTTTAPKTTSTLVPDIRGYVDISSTPVTLVSENQQPVSLSESTTVVNTGRNETARGIHSHIVNSSSGLTGDPPQASAEDRVANLESRNIAMQESKRSQISSLPPNSQDEEISRVPTTTSRSSNVDLLATKLENDADLKTSQQNRSHSTHYSTLLNTQPKQRIDSVIDNKSNDIRATSQSRDHRQVNTLPNSSNDHIVKNLFGSADANQLSSFQRIAILTIGVCCLLVVLCLLILAVSIKCRNIFAGSDRTRRAALAIKRQQLEKRVKRSIESSQVKAKLAQKRATGKKKSVANKNGHLFVNEFNNDYNLPCSSAESSASICMSTSSDGMNYIKSTDKNPLQPMKSAALDNVRMQPKYNYSKNNLQHDLDYTRDRQAHLNDNYLNYQDQMRGNSGTLRQRISGSITSRLLRMHLPRLLPYFALDYQNEHRSRAIRNPHPEIQDRQNPDYESNINVNNSNMDSAVNDLLINLSGCKLPLAQKHLQQPTLSQQAGSQSKQNPHLRLIELNREKSSKHCLPLPKKTITNPEIKSRKQQRKATSGLRKGCSCSSCSTSWSQRDTNCQASKSMTSNSIKDQQYNNVKSAKLPFGTASSVLSQSTINNNQIFNPLSNGSNRSCKRQIPSTKHNRLITDCHISDSASIQHSQLDNEHHLLLDNQLANNNGQQVHNHNMKLSRYENSYDRIRNQAMNIVYDENEEEINDESAVTRRQVDGNGIIATRFRQRQELLEENNLNSTGLKETKDGEETIGDGSESDNYYNLEHNYDGPPTFREDNNGHRIRQTSEFGSPPEMNQHFVVGSETTTRPNDTLQTSSSCNCNLVLYPL